jgi:hypothetical protein
MIWGVDATINCTYSPGTKPPNSIETFSPTASAVSAKRGCDDFGKSSTTDSAGAGTVVVTEGNVVVLAGTVVVTEGNVVVLAGTVVVTEGNVVVLAGTVVVVAGAIGLTEFEAIDAALLPIALIAITVKV